MSVFRDLEKRIDSQLRRLFASGSAGAQSRELVEIQRAILEEVEDRAQLLPRARRRFPYNDLVIRIAAPEADRRAAIDVVFVEGDALQHEIAQHLRREEIEAPSDLTVKVESLEDPPAEVSARGFHIAYAIREAAKPDPVAVAADTPAKRTVRLTVLHGDSEQPAYELSRARIHVGRLAEVLDDRRRPVRRNDVVFRESSDKPNSTVSRAHAHIEWDESAREFRLFDDGSAYGTSVIHEGRLVNVPQAGGRGLRISDGDEIYVGQARIRFEIL